MGDRARRATSTSNFGVGRREGHDAAAFYDRFVAPTLSDDAVVAPAAARIVDDVFAHDARTMPELTDASAALVVTSPPYFAGKAYEEALGTGVIPATYTDYLRMLEDVLGECSRVLEPGGRMAVNVANLGRKPFRSLAADVTTILQDRLGLLLRGEVVWVKARGATGSCAWGSFASPTNPVLRDLSERVLIAGKGRFDRAVRVKDRAAAGLPHRATITRDEFLSATLDVWELPSESATRVGHPAPFPVELPERLMQLFTFEGDLVVDPFMGSGSTAVAAVRTGRHFAGYDTDPAYVDLAKARVAAERVALDGRVSLVDTSAFDLASRVMVEAGLTATPGGKVKGGVEPAFRVTSFGGREVLVDVVGGLTTGRRGLADGEEIWKAIGRAGVALAVTGLRTVVLSTSVPSPRSPLASTLGAASGPTGPLVGVVDLAAPDAAAALATLLA